MALICFYSCEVIAIISTIHSNKKNKYSIYKKMDNQSNIVVRLVVEQTKDLMVLKVLFGFYSANKITDLFW